MKLPLFIQRHLNKNKPPLKVYWWRYDYPNKLNFGDEITPYIIESIWNRKCEWTDITKCSMVGAGSLIEMVQHATETNPIKVWGSGFIKQGPRYAQKNLDFYAIRGKKACFVSFKLEKWYWAILGFCLI